MLNSTKEGKCKEEILKLSKDDLLKFATIAYQANEHGDSERALAIFDQLAKLLPSSTIIQLGIAISKISLKKFDEAILDLKQLIEKESFNAEILELIASAYAYKGQFSKSESYFRKAVELDPSNVLNQFNLGTAYHSLGKLDEAKEQFEKCLTIAPDFIDAYFGLALILEESKKYEQAIQVYDEIIRLDPTQEEAWYNQGVLFTYINNREKSIQCYKKAVELDPNNSLAWSNIGVSYAYLKDYKSSIVSLKKALRKDYNNAIAWYNLGTSYSALSSFERGIMCFEHATELSPSHQDAWINLGSAYFDTHNITQAIDSYKSALTLDSDNTLALIGMINASVALLKDNGKNATQIIFEKLSNIPTAIYVLNDVGTSLSSQGLYAIAIDCFKKCVSIKKDFADAWFNLGFTYADLNDDENVINSYTTYVKIVKDNKDAWNNLGNAYLRKKEFHEAVRCYDEAIRIDENFTEAITSKAQCLIDLKEYSSAIQLCIKATKLDPTNPLPLILQGQVMLSTKKYSEAITLFSKAKELDDTNEPATVFLAIAFSYTKKFNELIHLLEPIKRSNTLTVMLGSAYAMMGDYEKAVNMFEEAQFNEILLPRELLDDLIFSAGLSYLKDENYNKAAYYLSRASNTEKNKTPALEFLGLSYLKLGDFEKAISVLNDTMKRDPSNLSILNNLTFAYWKTNDFENMFKVLDIQTKINPNDGQVWSNIGILYLNNYHCCDKALDAFSHANSLDPSDTNSQVGIIQALICKGLYTQAGTVAEKLLALQRIDITCISYYLLLVNDILKNNSRPDNKLLQAFFKAFGEMDTKDLKEYDLSGLMKTIDGASITNDNKALATSLTNIIQGKITKGALVNLAQSLLNNR